MTSDWASSGPCGTPSLASRDGGKNLIPRKLVRIPPDQRELLDRDDSWYGQLERSKHGRLVNLPAAVLDQVKYFHTSQMLPPPAQKPPVSSISTPTQSNREKKRASGQSKDGKDGSRQGIEDDDDGDDDDDDNNDNDGPEPTHTPPRPTIETDWSSSPPTAHRRRPPREFAADVAGEESGGEANGDALKHSSNESAPQQSLPSPHLSQQALSRAPASQARPDITTTSSSQIQYTGLFRSQPSHPNLRDFMGATSSPSKSTGPSEIPQTQQTTSSGKGSSKPSQQSLETPLPQTDHGVSDKSNDEDEDEEDELEMDIPGALSHAATPVNRSATVRHPIPSTFTETPPCGQGSMIPSTYTDPRKAAADAQQPQQMEQQQQQQQPKKRTMRRIRFEDPPLGLFHSVPTKEHERGLAAMRPPPVPAPDIVISSSASQIACTFPLPEAQGRRQQVPSAGRQAPPSTGTNDKSPDQSRIIVKETPLQRHNQMSQEQTSPRQEESNEELPTPINPGIMTTATDTPSKSQEDSTDPAELFAQQPLDAFRTAYPTFNGSVGDFVRACVTVQNLRRSRRLPMFLYDDFIRVFCDRYIPYVEEADREKPLSAMAWYVENVGRPMYNQGVVTGGNLDCVFTAYADKYAAVRRSLGSSELPAAKTVAKASEKLPETLPTRPAEVKVTPIRSAKKPLGKAMDSPIVINDQSSPSRGGEPGPSTHRKAKPAPVVRTTADSAQASVTAQPQKKHKYQHHNESPSPSPSPSAQLQFQQPPPKPKAPKRKDSHDADVPESAITHPAKKRQRSKERTHQTTTKDPRPGSTTITVAPPPSTARSAEPLQNRRASDASSSVLASPSGMAERGKVGKKSRSHADRFRQHLEKMKAEGRLGPRK